jgi:proline iminopeptidase
MSVRAAALAVLLVGSGVRAATFETGGVTIWYEVRGSGAGTPLIVANGGPGFDHSYLLCGDVWDTLAKGRKVVFYDQRGNGLSSELKDGQPCGLAEQIDDLDALRAHLGFEKLDLLGHSWGGYLVMAYAARHPERVAHLMIVDSAAPKIQDTVVYRQNVNKAVWGDLQRFDLNPELAKFAFPTLVVTGRYDFNVAPSVAWAIHGAIPRSELAVFEKSGHLPFCEEPAAFVSRVETFLAK